MVAALANEGGSAMRVRFKGELRFRSLKRATILRVTVAVGGLMKVACGLAVFLSLVQLVLGWGR
ncbi:hypothetical protein ASG17_11945 [Brevundimonas sp. Leaf363]|nr:hypothetical protein ASG17_11945 [Brevundimonas sp. Leaf363]